MSTIYEFTGYKIRTWRVAKETEKTYQLIDDNSKIGSNSYRLNKRDLDHEEWNGRIFSFDFQKAKAAALKELEDGKRRLEKLTRTIEGSISQIEQTK